MNRLPHVVWDMGGIVYTYFTDLMVEVGEREGWPLDSLPLGPTGRTPDPDYERMLEGELDEPEYLGVVKQRLRDAGIAFDPVADIVWGDDVARQETIGVMTDLEAWGHRQAVLTNDATRWLGPNWRETWKYRFFFEVMIDVVDVGIRKPAPQPYLAVVRALDAPPGDCLFIDDMPVNVRGAEAVGMQGFLFEVTDPVGSIGKLRLRLGVDG